MINVKEKEKKAFSEMKERFGYTSRYAAPRMEKVVVSVGTGKMSKADKKRNEFIADRIAKITGQKPVARGAKIAIASFKSRQGDIIGYSVTLRKERMYSFLDRLFNVTMPRIRDFRGFDKKSIDQMGNLTLGLKEHNVFPETADEELKDVFGLAVTIVTTAKSKDEAAVFFEVLGVPFKKK